MKLHELFGFAVGAFIFFHIGKMAATPDPIPQTKVVFENNEHICLQDDNDNVGCYSKAITDMWYISDTGNSH